MIEIAETLTLHPENTGGDELTFERRMVTVDNPYVPESTVRPERADLETLIWHNSEKHEGKKIQYVVMGGMNINAVEVHPVLSMLMNHADTVVGIAHPDAPQSVITPHDSPFNDEGSFANSGFTVLRAIEQLIQDGTLDPENPITVVGYSTSCAVLIEAVAQDQQEARNTTNPRKKYISSAVLLAPGGMLDIGEEEILKGAMDSGAQHWEEFRSDQAKKIKTLIKHPSKLFAALADAMAADDPIENYLYLKQIHDEWSKNLKAMENWPKEKEWETIKTGHIWFERVENWLKTPRIQFIDSLLAHFHITWINQPGWPHLSPETAAFKRSKANVGYDVTQEARSAIHDTPVIMWLGKNDKAIQASKFLTSEDIQKLDATSDTDERIGLEEDLIIQRAKEAFPGNSDNIHVVLSHGNHITPRFRANVLEYYVLRYLHPDLLEQRDTFVGSSKR